MKKQVDHVVKFLVTSPIIFINKLPRLQDISSMNKQNIFSIVKITTALVTTTYTSYQCHLLILKFKH